MVHGSVGSGGRLSFFHPTGRSGGVAVALVVGSVLAGCRSQVRITLAPDVSVPNRSVIVFFPDGMDRGRFHQLLDEGSLPNIERVFVAGGVSVCRAISEIPSVTYPNHTSLITGRFIGRHGITGNQWFDRSTLIGRDYGHLGTYRQVNQDLKGPTVFRLLNDHLTVGLQEHTHAGASVCLDNECGFPWQWVFQRYLAADAAVVDYLPAVARLARQRKRWPSLLLFYFPGVDEVGHRDGPDSDTYAKALCNIDAAVGKVVSAVAEAGLDSATTYALLTDHNMLQVDPVRAIDLAHWLTRQRGLQVRTDTGLHGLDYAARRRGLASDEAVLVTASDRSAMIHLRGRGGWDTRPRVEEVEAFVLQAPSLCDLPAVDLALTRAGPQAVRVWSSAGCGLLEGMRDEQGWSYRADADAARVLGYDGNAALRAFIETGWRPCRAWLEATADTDHPDFVPQAVALMSSPRVGDIVLFARVGANFRRDFRGAHGGCLAADVRIPLYFAGPDLPAGGTISCARLVDVAPTILGLLNEAGRLNPYAPLDGIDLTEQLRAAD